MLMWINVNPKIQNCERCFILEEGKNMSFSSVPFFVEIIQLFGLKMLSTWNSANL